MLYIAAFFIPALMYGSVLYLTHTFPFGDNSMLFVDIDAQFAAFFTYFKHTFSNNNNLIYTFGKSLGGDMTGFSGYYLNNPFIFLILPFQDKYIPVGIVLIIGLQISFMGLTMAILLKDIRGPHLTLSDKLKILTCSTAYAFMGYNLAYLTSFLYFNSIIMLPLVMLGIRKLLKGEIKLYVIALTLSIIFNYYIGYMICIFSLIFLLYSAITSRKYKDIGLYAKYLSASLLSAALSAFTLVPTVLSLSGQKDAPSFDIFKPHTYYKVTGLIRNLFVGGFRGDTSNYSAPYIYVGEIILAGVAIYLISKKNPPREKAAYVLTLFILLVSTYISTFDVIWHGFNEPVGIAHRQAFLICAFIILGGYQGLCTISDRMDNKYIQHVIMGILLCLEILLLTANAVISMNHFENRSLTEYGMYYNFMEECISDIEKEDGSFYRIEKDFERNHNDAMMLSYNGLSHNSSCDKDYAKRFLAKMGIRYFDPIWTYYNQGSTVFTDCFLGVKYYISRFDTTIKPYESVFSHDGKDSHAGDMTAYVYKNPYALPLCFGMKDEQLAADMSDENLFEIENEMAGMPIYTDAAPLIENVTTDDEISVDVNVTKECNLYFYATAPDYQGAALFVNDEPAEEYFSVSRWNIVNIGKYEPGETVNVKLKATGGPITVDRMYIYAEDLSMIPVWYELASKDAGKLTKITSSHLTGSINVTDSDRIVFTIPYERSWKVKIDGQDAETAPAFGALLSLTAAPGEHTIDMTYIPEGLIPGIIISTAALLSCLGLTFFSRTFKIVVDKDTNKEELKS
ncbi:MAG: YfhO family protein [Lachnospiraceae bacterium]|nr:YfhO family protein [Lachnospiraceae bacterium]